MSKPDPKQIMRSKGAPFTDDLIAAMSDKEAWDWIYEHCPPANKRKRVREPQVYFTGFAKARKDELAAIAIGRGYAIAKSMVNSLALLVTGEQPGAAKVTKAEELGIPIMTEEQFLERQDDR